MIAQDRRQARCARCTARGTPYGMSWQRSGTSPDPKFAGAAAIPQDLPVEMSGEGSNCDNPCCHRTFHLRGARQPDVVLAGTPIDG
jgi:hypothetical protein